MFIFIFPYRFTNDFYNKYNICELKKNLNVPMEVHDLSYIVNKDWRKAFNGKKSNVIKEFKSIDEWKKYIENKLKIKKKIFILSELDLNNFNSILIHRILNKKEITLLQYKSPEIYVQQRKKLTFSEIIFKFFILLFSNYKRLIFTLKQRFLNYFIKLIKFKKLIILYSGRKKYLLPYLNSSETSFVNYNSCDFSNYISYKNKFLKKNNKIVFLDSNALFFSDKKLFGFNINYDDVTWYKSLNKYLLNVQKNFKLPVVIIPHPRSRKKKNKFYSSKLKVMRDDNATIKAIKDAKLVFAISATTAVSYSVIFNKPVNFIYNEQIKKKNQTQFKHMKNLAKVLGTKFINLDKEFMKRKINLKINKKLYNNYKYNYLTSKKTENKKNFEILNENFFN